VSKTLYRGSRKHILDWTERKEEFVQGINKLLKPTDAFVGTSDFWMPNGYERPAEARLCNVNSEYLGNNVKASLANWWLVHKKNANTPNWDLLVTCTIEGRKGLVLFEAKANVSELKEEGKILKPDASKHSRDNHARIGKAIEEVQIALAKTIPGVNISRDSHYQLSNRIAYAYKLAFMGIPVVLVYLGFLNDRGIIDAGEPFRSDKHWRKVLEDHMGKVLPVSFTERQINCNGTPMQMLIRSRKIYQVSSPQSAW